MLNIVEILLGRDHIGPGWRMLPFLVTNVINYVILANTIPYIIKKIINFVSLANAMAIM